MRCIYVIRAVKSGQQALQLSVAEQAWSWSGASANSSGSQIRDHSPPGSSGVVFVIVSRENGDIADYTYISSSVRDIGRHIRLFNTLLEPLEPPLTTLAHVPRSPYDWKLG
jgi:hypothetical protein